MIHVGGASRTECAEPAGPVLAGLRLHSRIGHRRPHISSGFCLARWHVLHVATVTGKDRLLTHSPPSKGQLAETNTALLPADDYRQRLAAREALAAQFEARHQRLGTVRLMLAAVAALLGWAALSRYVSGYWVLLPIAGIHRGSVSSLHRAAGTPAS